MTLKTVLTLLTIHVVVLISCSKKTKASKTLTNSPTWAIAIQVMDGNT